MTNNCDEPSTRAELENLLESLRWKEDMLVTNPFGERAWLKPLYRDGVRVGITDCCEEEYPCERHK